MLADNEEPDARSWIDRARGGDADAFCELCRIHEPGLLRQAMALCGDAGQAEDLAQETLVEAWKCLHRYDGRCRFFTWLCAILLNRHRNSRRKKRLFLLFGRSEAENETGQAEAMPDDTVRPDQAAQEREEAELLWKCVHALPRKQEQVVYLRFYVDHSLEGIAGALGCSVGTVKSRLFHALNRLRRMKELGTHR